VDLTNRSEADVMAASPRGTRLTLSFDAGVTTRYLPRAIDDLRLHLEAQRATSHGYSGSTAALEAASLEVTRDRCLDVGKQWYGDTAKTVGERDASCQGYRDDLRLLAGACAVFASQALQLLAARGHIPTPLPPQTPAERAATELLRPGERSEAPHPAARMAATRLVPQMLESWRANAGTRLPLGRKPPV